FIVSLKTKDHFFRRLHAHTAAMPEISREPLQKGSENRSLVLGMTVLSLVLCCTGLLTAVELSSRSGEEERVSLYVKA
ncbi:MAG: hypothetical protein IKD66_15780, partial [Solobacterium sp.]|nr:hypothetical protein [Solobacterium sp.]